MRIMDQVVVRLERVGFNTQGTEAAWFEAHDRYLRAGGSYHSGHPLPSRRQCGARTRPGEAVLQSLRLFRYRVD